MGCQFCSNSKCQNGGICNNLITNGLNCDGWQNQAYIPTLNLDSDKCGCNPLITSNCVAYSGTTTPCLGIITGTNLTNIIQAIDKAICLVSPSGISPSPSGVPTVSGTVNQIVVTPTGTTPLINYQVGLSSVVTGEISTIQTQISNISTFLTTCITNLTTNTPQNLNITNPSTNNWNIDFTQTPSGQSGVLYSDYSNSTTSNTSATVVKTYSLVSTTFSKNGDKVIARTRFVCPLIDKQIYAQAQVHMAFAGVTIASSFVFESVNITMFDIEMSIQRFSNTTVEIILKLVGGSDNGTYYISQGNNPISYIVPVAGLNLTTTSYPIDCVITSGIAGDTTCQFLTIDYLKAL